MIFLIEYDRRKGKIVTIRSFQDSEKSYAEKSRLSVELDLRREKREHEVVLLEAADEIALHRTHRRYFEDISQIVKSANGSN
jgi:hypothetical protein